MQLEEGETFFFPPHTTKESLMVDELEGMSPIMTSKVSQ